MALRAGYHGLKSPLNKTIPLTVQQMQASLIGLHASINYGGAKNLLSTSFTGPTTSNGVTYTKNADNSVTAAWSNTPTGNAVLTYLTVGRLNLTPGVKYILSGCPKGGEWSTSVKKYRLYVYNSTDSTEAAIDTGDGVEFTPVEGKSYGVFAVIGVNAGSSGTLTFKPMIRVAEDTDNTYVPYAMTNLELTGSAADQKTAINAIISAATGAADFAAFKTAMTAISPVTRSGVSEMRGAIQEEPDPEPETVTKKRSTSKKTTKEEV